MSVEDNKRLVRRYLAEVWERGDVEASLRFLTRDYRRHVGPFSPPLSPQGQRKRLERFRSAFPDIRIVVEDMVAEADRVAFRFTLRGTHRGPFHGLDPTGFEVEVPGLDIVRIENGLLAEHWGGADLNALLGQLQTGERH